MKEENKKTKTTKKASASKTTATKKVASAKKTTTVKKNVSSKKSTPAKKVASTVKKAPAKKVTAAKKTTATKSVATKKTITKVEPEKKVVQEKVDLEASKTKVVYETKKEVVNEPKIISEQKKEGTINKDTVMKVILFISYILIFVFIIIGFVEYLVYSGNNVNTSENTPYIISSKVLNDSNIIDLEDAKFKLSSLSGDYFIYLNYTSGSASNFEKNLKELIDKYSIRNNFYYINLDSVKNEDNKEELVNKYLGYNSNLITKLPTIVYVDRNGEVRKENIIIKKNNSSMTIGDFQSLLDINQYKEGKK